MEILPPNFVFSQFVPRPANGRRLVIPDIHGSLRTFQHILETVALTSDDQLFLLGDYIHKGANSRGTIDTILELQRQNFQIFPLRGNHEQMFLEYTKYPKPKFTAYMALKQRTFDMLDTHLQILKPYQNFLENLPYFYELDNYYLVHAGFNFESPNPFADYQAMLWTREWKVKKRLGNEKQIVFGHTPVELDKIISKIDHKKRKLPLDNGCVYKGQRKMFGNLLCLDLDSLNLWIQPNIDYDNYVLFKQNINQARKKKRIERKEKKQLPIFSFGEY